MKVLLDVARESSDCFPPLKYQVSENYLFALHATHAEDQLSQQQAIYDQVTSLTVSIFQFVHLLR